MFNNRIKTIENLISEGKSFKYSDNSYVYEEEDIYDEYSRTRSGNPRKKKVTTTYSRASTNLRTWIANVQSVVENFYMHDIGIRKLYMKFDDKVFNGYVEETFDKNLKILLDVLEICKTVQPQKIKNVTPKITIKNNPVYFTVMGFLLLLITFGYPFMYKLGGDNATAKVDKELSGYVNENTKLTIKCDSLYGALEIKTDSTIIDN